MSRSLGRGVAAGTFPSYPGADALSTFSSRAAAAAATPAPPPMILSMALATSVTLVGVGDEPHSHSGALISFTTRLSAAVSCEHWPGKTSGGVGGVGGVGGWMGVYSAIMQRVFKAQVKSREHRTGKVGPQTGRKGACAHLLLYYSAVSSSLLLSTSAARLMMRSAPATR